MKTYKEKNRVVSFTSSTAQGLSVVINEWFLNNLDEADGDVKYFKGLDFYYNNGSKTHCAVLHWIEDVEIEDDENEETSD